MNLCSDSKETVKRVQKKKQIIYVKYVTTFLKFFIVILSVNIFQLLSIIVFISEQPKYIF